MPVYVWLSESVSYAPSLVHAQAGRALGSLLGLLPLEKVFHVAQIGAQALKRERLSQNGFRNSYASHHSPLKMVC